MKKAIVLLLALTVIGGAVFAQATVNGYVRAKVAYAEAGVNYVDRLRMNFGYMTEDKNVSFAARFQASTGSSAAADWNSTDDLIYWAYGSVKLFDGMVKVTGGKVDNYDYWIGSSSTDWNGFGAVHNAAGNENTRMLLAQFYPVEGLNVGVGVKSALTAADFSVADLEFSAMYAMDGLGKVVLYSDMGADLDASLYSGTFQFTGVEGLAAAVGYKHNSATSTEVFGVINYKVSPELVVEVSPSYNLDASSIYAEAFAKYTASTEFAVAGLGKFWSDPAVGENAFLAALEVYFTTSKMGLLQTGLTYGDVSGINIPVIVKVSF